MGGGSKRWLCACAIATFVLGCRHRDDDAHASGSAGGSGIATLGSGASESSSADDDTPHGDVEIVKVEITPSAAQIDVDNGVIGAPVEYTAIGTTVDGEQVPVVGEWSFDRPDLATLTGHTLAATGLAGGTGNVTFTLDDLDAEATLLVKLTIVDDPQEVPPEVKDAFDDAVLPDPALDLLYPYDRTVFPRGLAGPTMMWNGGGAADIYRVHVESSTFDFTGYASAPPPSRYALPLVPSDVWLQLTDSVIGDVSIELQRWDGTNAYLPETRTWTISTANLRGSIYYWEVNNGDVVRLDPGAAAPTTFLEKQEGQCVACHSVSRDGSTIVASHEGGYSPWSLFDAGSGEALYTTDDASGFQAISPEGDYVVWRQWSDASFAPSAMVLSLADSNAPLALLEPPGGTPVHPAWSPDGHTIAFGLRTDGNGLDFTSSTLWLASVDVDTPQFGDLRQIAANDATRPAIIYPTFSPDSQWLAFNRATQSRTRGAAGELWMIDTGGTTELLLQNANGVAMIPDAQQHASYEPTFSPVSAGGYFWLVFVSERTYGNLIVDEEPTTRRKQLWVTAIDASPQPGQDPSHPAFWLPGQDPADHNMRGSWALSPCKGLGAPCEAGYECCEGFCIWDEDAGENVCGVPQGCAQLDDACDTAADCCDDAAVCIGGFCTEPFIP